MTHDELLAKIKETGVLAKPIPSGDWIYDWKTNALYAVMELHKPWNNGDKDICQECANLIDPWSENCYPCPTIKAIEKELNL